MERHTKATHDVKMLLQDTKVKREMAAALAAYGDKLDGMKTGEAIRKSQRQEIMDELWESFGLEDWMKDPSKIARATAYINGNAEMRSDVFVPQDATERQALDKFCGLPDVGENWSTKIVGQCIQRLQQDCEHNRNVSKTLENDDPRLATEPLDNDDKSDAKDEEIAILRARVAELAKENIDVAASLRKKEHEKDTLDHIVQCLETRLKGIRRLFEGGAERITEQGILDGIRELAQKAADMEEVQKYNKRLTAELNELKGNF